MKSKNKDCEHPSWVEEGDGHGHNYWSCTDCDTTQWIAPWVLNGSRGLDF